MTETSTPIPAQFVNVFQQVDWIVGQITDIQGSIHYLKHEINQLVTQETKVMTIVQDILAGQTQLKSDFEAFVAQVAASTKALQDQIAALQAQIAAGGTITEADLAPVKQNVDDLDAEVKSASSPVPAPTGRRK